MPNSCDKGAEGGAHVCALLQAPSLLGTGFLLQVQGLPTMPPEGSRAGLLSVCGADVFQGPRALIPISVGLQPPPTRPQGFLHPAVRCGEREGQAAVWSTSPLPGS